MLAGVVSTQTVEIDAGGWGVFVVLLFAFFTILGIAAVGVWKGATPPPPGSGGLPPPPS